MEKEQKEFTIESLADVSHDFNLALDDLVIATDGIGKFAFECGKLLWEVNNEMDSLVECVSYKFGLTKKEALLFLGGLHAGWRIKDEIEITTGNGMVVTL